MTLATGIGSMPGDSQPEYDDAVRWTAMLADAWLPAV